MLPCELDCIPCSDEAAGHTFQGQGCSTMYWTRQIASVQLVPRCRMLARLRHSFDCTIANYQHVQTRKQSLTSLWAIIDDCPKAVVTSFCSKVFTRPFVLSKSACDSNKQMHQVSGVHSHQGLQVCTSVRFTRQCMDSPYKHAQVADTSTT